MVKSVAERKCVVCGVCVVCVVTVWCMYSKQMWRHHLATFKKVIVTPALIFEFVTTLTYGALRINHIVSTAFETIAKKK